MEFKFTIGRVYSGSRDATGRLFYPNLNSRMHWCERNRWTSAFKQMAWGLCAQAKSMAKFPNCKKAKITVFFYTCQPKDLDNAYGSCKALIDGIVATQVIPDDKDSNLDLQVKSIKVSKRAEQRTEIVIKKIK
jgi:hypothetical protein